MKEQLAVIHRHTILQQAEKNLTYH